VIEGIRYQNLQDQYPRFLLWSDLSRIGVFEMVVEPVYAVVAVMKNGDEHGMAKKRTLTEAEAVYDSIMEQIAAGATIIEVPA